MQGERRRKGKMEYLNLGGAGTKSGVHEE